MSEMPPHLAVNDEKSKEDDDDDELTSEDSDCDLPLCFDEPRHLETIKGVERVEHTWRLKEKYKTHCVALVLCLNVGTDPPDVVKTQPCAKLECWIDPLSMSSTKALESIGHALQAQYERWQPRARYKQSLDPTSDEVKKLCTSLRRNAKDERVLFHYNGHGVPKPTNQGEIWVFNRAYTQYIPLSMYDLQSWMGAPSLYVYDCSNAGVIVEHFKTFACQHDREAEGGAGAAAGAAVSHHQCLQLAACAAGQTLPMHPELPADLFTACLTAPVKMAVRWFVQTARTRVTPLRIQDLIDKIPGQASDRRTMLGELNWIFTAITDTIAWSSLPADTFQQLFRADLLTASLFRNFLLADRIMRSYNCTPVSSPALPSLATHPLWAAWDQTLDLALAQLPAVLGVRGELAPYRHSPFFRDQLTAFQVWLDLGKYSPTRPPPHQLPMVLQVLLSTLHRVRALQTLCRFLALGEWAVRAVLAVGIFPYMLKLLQASAHDLRASMVYIWAKIIAVDPSCQVDLVNAKGHKYFLSVLADPTVDSSHRTLAAYVLAGIVEQYPAGQEAALQGSLVSVCLEQVSDSSGGEALRRWACVCLARVWRDYDAAKWSGVRDLAHEKLYPLLRHAAPELRAAAVHALATYVRPQPGAERCDHALALEHQVAAELAARVPHDASHLVRQEILAALQWLVLTFEQYFIAVSIQERLRRSDKEGGRNSRSRVDPGQDALEEHVLRKVPSHSSIPAAAAALPTIGFGSVYMKLWGTLCELTKDPHPQVAAMANDIVNYIVKQVESVGHETTAAEARATTSSLPPSPNTRADMLTHHARTLPHLGHRRGKSGLPNTISEDPTSRDSTSSSTNAPTKKAIVSTQFVAWASAEFSRCSEEEDWRRDRESRAYHERRWRYCRNQELRREARALRRCQVSRVETQVFNSRCPLPPAVVAFHPYEQQLAVASKDNFGVWDWGTGAKLCAGAWRRGAGRITALCYLNAHDRALLAVASHSGCVAVWGPAAAREPRLLAAWRGLDVRPHADRPPPAQPLYSLAQLVSEQFMSSGEERSASGARPRSPQDVGTYGPPAPATSLRWCGRSRTLAVAGHAPAVRLWDVHAELRLCDVATRSEAAVTALWRGGGQLLAGLADGAVRGWDERAPHAATLALQEHAAPVLCVRPRPDRAALVTAAADGEVRVYDLRTRAVLHRVSAPAPVAAVAVHPVCALLACGSTNQSISIYDLKGALLNSIKFHEGFMAARIGPVSCLAFHPLRCALAVGTRDSSVSVYVSEPRR